MPCGPFNLVETASTSTRNRPPTSTTLSSATSLANVKFVLSARRLAQQAHDFSLIEREVLAAMILRLTIGWILGFAGQHIFYLWERSWQVAHHNPFTQWDAVHYLRIASTGYDVHSTPFFPLYPLLLRLVHVSTFGLLGYEASGVALGIVALFAALVTLRRFLTELIDEDAARFGVLLLLWSPASVFLLSNYNSALLVFLLSHVALMLLRGNFFLASASACLAAATHPLGLSAVVGIGVAISVNREWRKLMPCIALSLSGFGAYCLYLKMKFGSPLVFQTQQHFYGKRFTFPFESLWNSFIPVFRENLDPAGAPGMQFVFQFEMITVLIAVATTVYLAVHTWRKSTQRLPLWLGAMTLYQVFVAATLTFVPVFHFPVPGGQHTIALQVPVSYSRWFLTSIGFLVVASLVTRKAPRLRPSLLLVSGSLAIFLQTMFVAALRYY